MTPLVDLLTHHDGAVAGTARAMLEWMRELAPLVLAAEADDARSGVPLLGDRDAWRLPMTAEGDATRLEPCRWRVSRDHGCQCFRCESQCIELWLARAIVSPCAGCYTCRRANDPSAYAAGIVEGAQKLAAAARRPVEGPAPRRARRRGRPALAGVSQ